MRYLFVPLVLILIVVGMAFPSGTPDSVKPVPRGNRMVGLDISSYGSDAENGYNNALELSREIGCDVIDLHLGWSLLQDGPDSYEWLDSFAFLPEYYGTTDVALTIAVIDTVDYRIPSHLEGQALSEITDDFIVLLDRVFSTWEGMNIVTLSIGNEVDIFLGDDDKAWTEWLDFYSAAASYAATRKEGSFSSMNIGCKTTLYGSLQPGIHPYVEAIHDMDVTDAHFTTYYPLEAGFTVRDPQVVYEDLAAITNAYSKSIYMLEIGYPGSTVCGSSEAKQAEFIEVSFAAWDELADRIPLMIYTWSHDSGPAILDDFKEFYGISDKRFVAYLSSLGLRSYEDEPKPGWTRLVEELKIRGW